jgi:hypothetical protein
MKSSNQPPFDQILADHKGTEAALRKAGQEAVLDHARAGFPVATWKDGKVVWLQPDEVFALLGVNAGNGQAHVNGAKK